MLFEQLENIGINTKYFMGYKWCVPTAFSTPIKKESFNVGDTLYKEIEAYESWGTYRDRYIRVKSIKDDEITIHYGKIKGEYEIIKTSHSNLNIFLLTDDEKYIRNKRQYRMYRKSDFTYRGITNIDRFIKEYYQYAMLFDIMSTVDHERIHNLLNWGFIENIKAEHYPIQGDELSPKHLYLTISKFKKDGYQNILSCVKRMFYNHLPDSKRDGFTIKRYGAIIPKIGEDITELEKKIKEYSRKINKKQ